MTPILGILASGISGNLWQPGKDYDSIATTTVGAGGASTITFSSVPSTYKHLQVRAFGKVGTATNVRFRLNSDTSTSTYSYHYLYGDGSTPSAGNGTGTGNFGPGYVGYMSSNAQFGSFVIDILDYANTNKYKTARSLLGVDANGSGNIMLSSSVWLNTAAVSNLEIYAAYNFAEYSSFALYGVK
jgi:hypothetical protein